MTSSQSASSSHKTSEAPRSNGSVLIVEDEAVTAMAIKRSLQSLGYEVTAIAASGREAVQAARMRRPDVVLMDVRLPGEMDGVATAALLKDELDLPIVFVTAHSDSATVERVRVTEPYGYLVKPYTDGALRAAVEVTLYTHKARSSRRGRTGERGSREISAWSGERGGVNRVALDRSIGEMLQSHPLLESLTSQERELLVRGSSVRTLKPGEMIAPEGDDHPQLFVVRQGRLSMIKISNEGRELMIDLLLPGEFMGLLGAIEGASYDLVFRAPVRAEVLLLPSASFSLLLRENSKLLLRISQYLSQRLERAYDLALALAHTKVESRMASILCSLTDRQTSGSTNGWESKRIEVTRQELALLVGTSYETIIRTMKQMGDEGIIIPRGRNAIEIADIEKLRGMAIRQADESSPRSSNELAGGGS